MARRLTGQQTFAQPAPWYGRNLLINGDGVIAQRGSTITAATAYANDNDAYTLDRWNLVAELASDACDVSKETTDVPDGARSAMAMLVTAASQTTDGKFGLVQIVESENCRFLQGTIDPHVSLSFWVKKGAGFSSVGASVLAWDGTADAVESDVFTGGWGASDVAPTPASNWNLISQAGDAADISAGTAWTFIKMPGIAVDIASTENLAVAIYANDTTETVQGQELLISNVMLNVGKECLPFEMRSVNEELELCKRYFQKTFDQGTAPAQNAGLDGALCMHATSGGDGNFQWRFNPVMRTTPTVTTYNPASANSQSRNIDDGTSTAVSAANEGDAGVRLDKLTDIDDANNTIMVQATADAEL